MSRKLSGGAACLLLIACVLPSGVSLAQGRAKDAAVQAGAKMDPALAKDWLARWEKNITGDAANRYCDKEMGEEIGWLVSPFLNGFYYGYMATGDTQVDRPADRLVRLGHQARREGARRLHRLAQGGGGQHRRHQGLYHRQPAGRGDGAAPDGADGRRDSQDAGPEGKVRRKAEEYIQLSEQIFEKWDSRGAWRETKEGGLWVVPPFGIDQATGQWTEGYDQRNTDGFSLPDNKQNLIAMLAHRHVRRDEEARLPGAGREVVAGDEVAHEAARGRQVLRLELLGPGRAVGLQARRLAQALGRRASQRRVLRASTSKGIVAAYEHGLVFTKEDIDRLIATNRDFMWNQAGPGRQVPADRRRRARPAMGQVARRALGAPWRLTTRRCGRSSRPTTIPAGWGGLSGTPEWLARYGRTAEAGR